ncbi:MAG: FixH family protein [Spirochaetaceae bacterium]|nr:FixH family protein [Myxococcales bacterium]MCB9722434.1 FixH family protein [Spirochaetaceae bacterium]HPG29005.1 FixH family protein [Myxococcota bacterium]
MMEREGRELGSPWYRNFWPWFIVALLGTSVVGSLVTVAIALDQADVDVRIAEGALPTGPKSVGASAR